MPRATSPLTSAQARMQEALTDHVRDWVESTPMVSRVHAAIVTSVQAGAAADGSALAKVSVSGRDIPAPYLSSYTPAVGHIVAVARTGSTLLILGRVVGTPP